MDPGESSRRLSERGVGSVQFLVASGLGLILFLALANFVVVQYGRGAIRSALDQGARVAAVTGSADGCEARIDQVLGQLLGGVMGDGISAACRLAGDTAVAQASGVFPSWTPLSPDVAVEMTATAVREPP